MKDLIYHIPVVFFRFIIFIVLIEGVEFTVWKKGTHHIIKLETNSLSFFHLPRGSFVLEYAGLSNQRDYFLHGTLTLRTCLIQSLEYA